MLSRWTSVLIAFLLGTPAVFLGQPAPSRAADGAAPSQTAQTKVQPVPNSSPAPVADDVDDDSPDIPPFARGRISEKEYLLLRDKHIGMLRGVGDLARNPQTRSQAIRKMEVQEQTLRRSRAAAAKASGQPVNNLSSPAWTALRPDPIPNGQTSPTEVAVSGRVTAIAIDPADTTGNTVYVGTAQGGLYRTLDGGTTWAALMDTAQSLAIAPITIDPNKNPTLFVGTGEGNLSLDSFFGVGLYIIQNATTTADLSAPFHPPDATNPNARLTHVFTGRSITKILADPTDSNPI